MIHIKRFFELNSVRGPVKSNELLEFKAACSKEEWDAYVAQAEALLGGK